MIGAVFGSKGSNGQAGRNSWEIGRLQAPRRPFYGGWMQLPVRNAFAFAASVVETVAKHPLPLLIAFAWPALAQVLIPSFETWSSAWIHIPYPILNLLNRVMIVFFSVIALVGIVRYLILDEAPPLDPRRIRWRAVLMVSAVAVPFWIALGQIVNFGLLSRIYYGSNGLGEIPVDINQFAAIFAACSFVVYSVSLGVVYPLLGPIAVSERINFPAAWKAFRHSLPAIIVLAALLIAAATMAYAAYQFLVSYVLGWLKRIIDDLPYDSGTLDTLLYFLTELLQLPAAFLENVLPAIAVGHLTRGLANGRLAATTSVLR